MTIILILLGMIAVSFILYMFIMWVSDCRGWANLKYKDFLKYYNINPGRWDCRAHCVVYHRYINTYEEMREYFSFSFIDFCRYHLWLTNIERAAKKKEDAASVQRMLDDINKAEEQ